MGIQGILFAMNTETRGGRRPGAGRPPKDSKPICVRIDQDAYAILQEVDKKGEYISEAIKKLKEQ